MATGFKSLKSKKKTLAAILPNKTTEDPWEGIQVEPAFADESNASLETQSRTRGTIDKSGIFGSLNAAFPNISAFPSPFNASSFSAINTCEAIRICVQAYWAFPLLRNVIEIQAELANTGLILNGGNAKTNEFVSTWMTNIGIWKLKEQFFREWWRSGNVFIYRYDGKLSGSGLNSLQESFAASGDTIPIKYIILNPEHINVGGNFSFGTPSYYKVLTDYEISQLQSPKDKKKTFKSITEDSLRDIIKGKEKSMPLDANRLSVLLYKAQGYEPMAVPFCYGVLPDIEAKMRLKRADAAILESVDRMLLLITVGETPTDKNPHGFNPNTIQSLQNLFTSGAVARTLIADYTVKADWKIPNINQVLGKEKYAQINEDISIGLNASLFDSSEKFANASVKLKVFVERLKDAREAFITQFLQPEINRICETIKAKAVPTVSFEEMSLKDELQEDKFIFSMAQLGLLTAEETLEALKTGKMPSAEESLISQEKFKKQKDAGLYLPLIGGASQIQSDSLDLQEEALNQQAELAQSGSSVPILTKEPKKANGRPPGSKSPKTKTVSAPKGKNGTSVASISDFDFGKLQVVARAVSDLQNKIEESLRKSFGLKEFNDTQNRMSNLIAKSIISNENQCEWLEKAEEYIKEPKEINAAAEKVIEEIAAAHGIGYFEASILRLSLKDS